MIERLAAGERPDASPADPRIDAATNHPFVGLLSRYNRPLRHPDYGLPIRQSKDSQNARTQALGSVIASEPLQRDVELWRNEQLTVAGQWAYPGAHLDSISRSFGVQQRRTKDLASTSDCEHSSFLVGIDDAIASPRRYDDNTDPRTNPDQHRRPNSGVALTCDTGYRRTRP